MKNTWIGIFAIVLLIVGCKSATENQAEVRKTDYLHFNKDIGWRINVRVGFLVNNPEEIYENNKAGIEITENATGQKMDTSFIQNIFGFQLDSSNLFQSIVAESELDDFNEWRASNNATKRLFYLLYEEQGVKIDTTATTVETIGGIEFQTYSLRLFGQNDEVLMHQIFYSALISGNDFSVNIVGDSEKNMDKVKAVWQKSKFK